MLVGTNATLNRTILPNRPKPQKDCDVLVDVQKITHLGNSRANHCCDFFAKSMALEASEPSKRFKAKRRCRMIQTANQLSGTEPNKTRQLEMLNETELYGQVGEP